MKYKEGDRVVCVDNNDYSIVGKEFIGTRLDLTLGKMYKILDCEEGIYGEIFLCRIIIINDFNDESWEIDWRFKSLSELRRDKLEKLNSL